MIGSIRKHMKKSGAKIIVWLTLLSLAGGSFVSLIRFSRRFGSVDALASVGDYDISVLEYRRKFLSLAHLVQEIQRMYGPQADTVLALWGFTQKPEQLALDVLVQEKAIQGAADKLGAHVSKDYIEAKVRDPLFVREYLADLIPPQALEHGGLNVELLKRNLERQSISEDDFEDLVKNTMKRYILDRLVQGSIYVPIQTLKELYQKMYAKKKFGIASLGIEEYLKKARSEKIADDALKTYFDAHKETYRIPEKRNARLWTFDYDVTISPKEVESYYNQHKNKFIQTPEEVIIEKIVLKADDTNALERRKQAQEIMKAVKENPARFEEFARKYSQNARKEDAITPQTLRKGQTDPAVEATIFALQKGEISPVIQTQEGFDIVKVVDRKAPTYKAFDNVKNEILKILKRERFREDFTANASRVISQSSDLPEIFTRFIQEKKAQESTQESIVPSETPKAEKLFGLARKGDKAFYVEEDKGYIIELIDIKPSFIPELKTIEDKLLKDFHEYKARELLKVDLEKIEKNLSKGLKEAAQEVQAKVETTDWINPQHPLTLKKLDERVPMRRAVELIGLLSSVQEITPQGGYLIVLTEQEPFNEQDFERRKAELRAYSIQNEIPLVSGSFYKDLQAQAQGQVKVNEELWQRASSRV